MRITTRPAAKPTDGNPVRYLIRAAGPDAIRDAAAALRAGGLVAFATETVYGLGADAGNAEAVARIFAAKSRPRFNPLIVHIASIGAAMRIGIFDTQAERLAAAFWPGPMTLVVPRRADAPVAEIVTAGLSTIALRVPSAPTAAALIKEAGVPIAAPSANLSGHVSATTAAHVAADLGDAVAMVLDDGPSERGIESTIVEVTGDRPPRLLRAGAIARTEIEAVLGCRLETRTGEKINAPGQLESHYAPHAQLRLGAVSAHDGEVLVAFGLPPLGAEPILNLSPDGDLIEAAANLFSALRRLDELGVSRAAVMPIPDEGLGEAINDRLARAAAPRGPREVA